MDHAFFVSGSKGVGKLGGHFDKFANRNWPRAKALTEAFAFQQFRCEKGNAVVFADEVDGENIGMRGSCRGLSLLTEPPQAIGILQIVGMENFYGYVASKRGVARSITSPIPPLPNKERISYGPSFEPGAGAMISGDYAPAIHRTGNLLGGYPLFW
jgi:hypothetical protein